MKLFVPLALQLVVIGGPAKPTPPPTTPDTYFVSVSGNDLNSGDAIHPWRTIQKCATTVPAGSICSVAAGTFTEDIIVASSGLSGSVIRITGQSAATTTIVGNVLVSGDYVTVTAVGVQAQAGDTYGIKITGSFSTAESVRVTAGVSNLGSNNAGIVLSGGTGNTVTQSYVERTCFGITVSGTSHVVSNNEITDLRLTGTAPNYVDSNCGDVDYMRFFGTGHRFLSNIFHDIDRQYTANSHIDCFQTFDTSGNPITNILIDRNRCSAASQGVIATANTNGVSSGLTVTNNVFYDIGAWCALVETIPDAHFVNNTCDASAGLYGFGCRRVGGACEFKNNIVVGTAAPYGVSDGATLIDGDASAAGKNNLIYKSGTTLSTTGRALDVVNADPLFVDAASGDYRLQAGSPAVNAGRIIEGFPTTLVDLLGVSRPQGAAWDIGAYERVP